MSDARRDNDQNQGRTTLLDRMRNLLGLSPASLRDDIEDALEQPQNADDFSPQERVILRNVLELHEHRVRDIMIPRADIVAVGLFSGAADAGAYAAATRLAALVVFVLSGANVVKGTGSLTV